jgi:hypothetical protein
MKPALIKAIEAVRSAGPLTASRVVEAAADPQSPLHARFDWDDEHAAAAYRLVQARNLIQEFTISVSTRPGKAQTVRAFVNVVSPSRDPGRPGSVEGSYLPRAEVVGDQGHRASLLDQILSQFESVLVNNADLTELDVIVEAVASARRAWRGVAAAE